MLRQRVLSAAVLLPAVLLLLYLGGIPWTVAVFFVGILGWREMAQILRRNQFATDRLAGMFFVLGALGDAYLRSKGLINFDLLRPLLAGLLISSLIWALYSRSEQPTTDWAMTVASALYLGFLLSHFVSLRLRSDGFAWTTLVLLITWLNDTAAYFVGRAWGRHKLWPRISPQKTWEGLIAGTVTALIIGPLAAPPLVGIPWWQGLALGALIAAAAPFGDFSVSLFKRMAHIKDSSNLIPGHGGMLDRLDSLLFTIPVAVYFAWLVAGGG